MWRLQLLWMRWLHAKLIINLPETELASQPIGSLHDTLQMRLNSRVRPLAFHSECRAVELWVIVKNCVSAEKKPQTSAPAASRSGSPALPHPGGMSPEGPSDDVRGHQDASRGATGFTAGFINHKAGMEGVDQEKVKTLVHDMTHGGQHHREESRKDANTEGSIAKMKEMYASLSTVHIREIEARVRCRIGEMEAQRDLSRTWIHVDMDAFFAAVHTLERPELASVPMAVGGMSMISTANYVARKAGVRSAMPGFIAVKLCPSLVFVKQDFELYKQYAAKLREVYRLYDAGFDCGSLDEAYLDITEYISRTGMSGGEVAAKLRGEVEERTSLTCSAGVAPTRRLAKICSDMNKPNGQKVLASSRQAVVDFLSDLPVRKVGGIGKVLEGKLAAFQISTVGDLRQNLHVIAAVFTPATVDFLFSVALGIGTETRPPDARRKGLGHERTFAPTSDTRFIEAKLHGLAENVGEALQKEGLKAQTVTLKIKKSNFEVLQRQLSIPPSNAADVIADAAVHLLRKERPYGSLRLVGVKASNFDGAEMSGNQLTVDSMFTADAKNSEQPFDVESTYFCSEEGCGRNVPLEDKQMHEDWHLALRLSRQPTKRKAGESAAGTRTKGKRDPSQKTIMFAPK